jgi:hypothetical protein
LFLNAVTNSMKTVSVWGIQSTHLPVPSAVTGIRWILKLRAPSLVTIRKAPSTSRTLYSTLGRRGMMICGAAAGVAVGMIRHSDDVNPSARM